MSRDETSNLLRSILRRLARNINNQLQIPTKPMDILSSPDMSQNANISQLRIAAPTASTTDQSTNILIFIAPQNDREEPRAFDNRCVLVVFCSRQADRI